MSYITLNNLANDFRNHDGFIGSYLRASLRHLTMVMNLLDLYEIVIDDKDHLSSIKGYFYITFERSKILYLLEPSPSLNYFLCVCSNCIVWSEQVLLKQQTPLFAYDHTARVANIVVAKNANRFAVQMEELI